MNEMENLVLEGTENVEGTTTEEIVEQVAEPKKVYTEEEFNNKLDEVLAKKLARKEAKIRKEFNQKYGELESVLKAGTGKSDVGELTDTFKNYYESRGVEIPKKPTYSDRDIEVLARAEADDIIRAGFDEVIEETDRLAEKGLENMTAREKATFKALAEYRQKTERGNELSKIGVKADVLDTKEFKDFASKFSSNTSITEIYEIYNKTQPKKEIKTMGSIKNNTTDKGTIKDFYSKKEAEQFTKEDFDKNPALFKAVCDSMQKW